MAHPSLAFKGAGDELLTLKQLSSAIDTFVSYCAEVSVDLLQKLLTRYGNQELNELFEIQGSYVLGTNESGVLQAIYPKLLSLDSFDAHNQGDSDPNPLTKKSEPEFKFRYKR